VAALLGGFEAEPCAWALAGTVNQALQACANAPCGAGGAAWVEGDPAAGT
jgi:hypothetical protein